MGPCLIPGCSPKRTPRRGRQLGAAALKLHSTMAGGTGRPATPTNRSLLHAGTVTLVLMTPNLQFAEARWLCPNLLQFSCRGQMPVAPGTAVHSEFEDSKTPSRAGPQPQSHAKEKEDESRKGKNRKKKELDFFLSRRDRKAMHIAWAELERSAGQTTGSWRGAHLRATARAGRLKWCSLDSLRVVR